MDWISYHRSTELSQYDYYSRAAALRVFATNQKQITLADKLLKDQLLFGTSTSDVHLCIKAVNGFKWDDQEQKYMCILASLFKDMDNLNEELFRKVLPELLDEVTRRYHARGGVIYRRDAVTCYKYARTEVFQYIKWGSFGKPTSLEAEKIIEEHGE